MDSAKVLNLLKVQGIEMTFLYHALLIIASVYAQAAFAQAPINQAPTQDIHAHLQQVVDQYIHNNAFAGSILVAQSGTVVFQHQSEIAGIENQSKLDTDRTFALASLSKPITAALLLKLAESGMLKLEAPLANYLHVFDTPTHKAIQLRHLLSHTSGIANHFAISGWFDPAFHRSTSDKQFIQIIAQMPLVASAGEGYHYSNPGYFLLGKVVEQVTKQSFAASVQQYLFKPLAMQQSGILAGFETPPTLVSGYQWQPQGGYRAQQAKNMNLFGAGAALYATAVDLHRLDIALYENQFLSASSKAKLFDAEQAYSWRVSEFALADDLQKNVHQYDGNFDGYSSMMTRFIDDKHSVILLSNNGTSFHLKQQMTADLAKVLYQQPVPGRSQDADLLLINSVVNGNFDTHLEKIADGKAKVALSEQNLTSLGYDLLWSNLPFQSLKLFDFINNSFSNSKSAAANLARACQHRLTQNTEGKAQFCRE